MGDITKYLEGQYDGTGFQRGAQQIVDLRRSLEISQRVEETQLQAWEEEESRIAQIYGIPETDRYGVGNLMKAYDEEDRYNEYLVHGAVLTCDQATLEDFELPDGEKVVLEENPDISNEERCQSILEVWENPMSVNGKTYATVRDTIKDANVIPFRCNCKQKANRDAEVERIQSDPECGKYGVCRHLMQLNEKWDNMPRETGYMKREDVSPYFTGGVARILGSHSYNTWATEEEGITMTSVLFCRHGGLIRAITSGQEEVEESIDMVTALKAMDSYLAGTMNEEDLMKYIDYVASHCGLKVAQIGNPEDEEGDSDLTKKVKRKVRSCYLSEQERNYDAYILAWSYYWNQKIEEGTFGNSRVMIRPDVIKAMIIDESEWGSGTDQNASRDVMQCLFSGDYGLWILSGNNPKEIGRWHFDSEHDPVVWIVRMNEDGEEEYVEASRRKEFNEDYARFSAECGILQNVITIIGDQDVELEAKLESYKGEYLIHYDAVTPNLSIACGIGYLAYNIERQKTEAGGVAAYNGGGAETANGTPYTKLINSILSYLEYEEDGETPVPLQEEIIGKAEQV
ncbi:MAG: hypothetical protein HDQ98_00490 [Lachnospiraceae bacterium]|nr:hypothetical protein [Lachnospiraceae bacterium]